MQLSDLRRNYAPKRKTLQELWKYQAPSHKCFRDEARVLWDCWSARHRRVLLAALVDQCVLEALTVLPGEVADEDWHALIRCCLQDVFEAALDAANRGFTEPGGAAEFLEQVICSPDGVNSAERMGSDCVQQSLEQLAANVDDAGRNPETLNALLVELRTTYSVDLCLALCLQLLRILSSQALLRRVTGYGLGSMVVSYVPQSVVHTPTA